MKKQLLLSQASLLGKTKAEVLKSLRESGYSDVVYSGKEKAFYFIDNRTSPVK